MSVAKHIFCLSALFLMALAALGPAAAAAETEAPAAAPAWSEEVLDLFAKVPVQEGGRVKPFDTFAQFTLLKLNGKRWFTTSEGRKLYPVEWMLNCLFFPEIAGGYAHFIVPDDQIIVEIGLAAHDKKRSHYSYNELASARQTLMQKAMQYSDIEPPSDRSPKQRQILNLAHNVFQFQVLSHFLDFTKHRFSVRENEALAAVFPEEDGATLSQILSGLPRVVSALSENAERMGENALHGQIAVLGRLSRELEQAVAFSHGIALFPHPDLENKEWMTPQALVEQTFTFSEQPAEVYALLAHIENMAENRNDPAAFLSEAKAYQAGAAALAAERGEYSKVPLEVFFYKQKFIFYAQWLYVLSFLLVAISWLAPKNKALGRAAVAALIVPTLLLITGIILRCIIRARPPVSTLYETILFITAIITVCALIMEYVNRERIALSIGAFLGTLGMFLAYRYEVKEGVDTMPSLVAVLDTNFWLSTHVTTVTMGYAAGLLAAGLSHIYILGKLFNVKKDNPAFYKHITRMVYGIVCFGLLFSLVGTVLGGIWANDSWGRFWGWDPKES